MPSSLTFIIHNIDCDCSPTGCPTTPMTLQIKLGDINTGETIILSFPNGQPSVQRSNSTKKNLPPVNAGARLHLWQGGKWFYKATQPILIPSSNQSVSGTCRFTPAESGPPNCSLTISYTVKQKAMSGTVRES
jgi:hypothetical protein